MWKISGDEQCLWLGTLTPEEASTGVYGLWLLQNQKSNEPGFTNKLMYKTWGTGEKYLGAGHCPALPAHQGRLEGVMVMHGCLVCTVDDQTHALRYPESIELEPDTRRTWKLPIDCAEDEIDATRGIAIVRQLPKYQAFQFGEGADYHLRIFDCDKEDKSFNDILRPKSNMCRDWEWLMIEIFAGACLLQRLDDQKEYWLGTGYHLFLNRDLFFDHSIKLTCESQRIRGVAIHY